MDRKTQTIHFNYPINLFVCEFDQSFFDPLAVKHIGSHLEMKLEGYFLVFYGCLSTKLSKLMAYST